MSRQPEVPGAAARPRRWRTEFHSVRTRVIAALLVMVTAGMIIAGALSYLIQRAILDESVRDAIEQEIAELRAMAADVNPATGVPFASVGELLQEFLRTNIPGPYETMAGMIDGRLRLTSPDPSVDISGNPAIQDAGRTAEQSQRVEVATVGSSAGEVRVGAVPLQVAGDPTAGAFLVVYEIERQRTSVLAWINTHALVTVGTVALAGLVGVLVAGRLLRPLRDLRSATEIITSTDLSRRVEVRDGDDEVTHLALTFNSMLDRLEQSFAAQRRFLDDAGHELRTPITILRGHLEVLDTSDPADIDSTRALLLDELDRMQRLVDDLMLLSRAERPDFLVLQEIELPRLTDEVFERVRFLGPQRWRIDAQADESIRADPQRLVQAVVQLAANAAKFSPADSTIAVGSAWTPDRAELLLWVRDNGPGIEPPEQERIFTRFARAGTGRGVEGSGLGLSIVHAIVKAHGGRVDLSSAPGKGATFTLVIPAVGATAAIHEPIAVGSSDR